MLDGAAGAESNGTERLLPALSSRPEEPTVSSAQRACLLGQRLTIHYYLDSMIGVANKIYAATNSHD